MLSIKQLPNSERPYEKLEMYGEKALSNSELLAIILKTGTKEQTAVALAQNILSLRGKEDIRSLQEISLQEPTAAQLPEEEIPQPDLEQLEQEKLEMFVAGLSQLTPKEQELFDRYVAGLTTDVIMEQLNIKENTLKFHSKNLYSKLGVKSRKQLMELHNRTEKKSHSSQ